MEKLSSIPCQLLSEQQRRSRFIVRLPLVSVEIIRGVVRLVEDLARSFDFFQSITCSVQQSCVLLSNYPSISRSLPTQQSIREETIFRLRHHFALDSDSEQPV